MGPLSLEPAGLAEALGAKARVTMYFVGRILFLLADFNKFIF